MVAAVALIAIVVEAGAAIACHLLLTYPQSSRILWSPDIEQVRANWVADSSLLDRDLGGHIAPSIEPDPFFGDSEPCGSAYGDSFTNGAEVPFGEGWAERLSRMLGCRVANYAVGNYGIDQAYRRFEQIHDRSRFVLLGLDPNGIMDVVSQYDAWLGSDPVPTALKGRFVVDPPDRLNWISLPDLDADSFVALNRDPPSSLPKAYFRPGTEDGAVVARFPYTLTLARVAFTPSVAALARGHADWSGLYRADHPSGALRLTIAVSEAFAKLAHARGQRPLIVLLPVAGSFREAARFGHFEYTSLVNGLLARNIEVLDIGPAMIAANGGRSACIYFTRQDRGLAAWLRLPLPCGGHYSSRAHALVAQLVEVEMRRRGMLEH